MYQLLNFKVPVKQPHQNYSDRDGWVCKHNSKEETIEIRKMFRGSSLLIIVGVDGWNYKDETRHKKTLKYHRTTTATAGFNVRMTTNGPFWFTFEGFDEIPKIIEEAKHYLENWKTEHPDE